MDIFFDFNVFSTLILTTKNKKSRMKFQQTPTQQRMIEIKSENHVPSKSRDYEEKIEEHLNYTNDTLSLHLSWVIEEREKIHKQKKHY